MPTAKIILDTRRKTKKGYPIKLWISHKGDTRLIPLDIHCEADQFNQEKIKLTGINQSVKLTNIIRERKAEAELYFAKNNCKPLTCQELKEKLERKFAGKEVSSVYLSEYVETLRERLNKNNQPGTSKWYNSALASVKSFDKDIQLIDMDVTFLENFKAYHQGKGNSKNTINMYMRALSAILDKARKESLVPRSFKPFEDVEFPTEKSKPTPLDIKQLIKIKDAIFIQETPLWHHRNYFMFMFYCRGMNFIDMAYLERKEIKGDYIIYNRSKTIGKEENEFRIFILPQIRNIINLYDCQRFVFPIMKPRIDLGSEQAMKDKDQALSVHNKWIKRIAKSLKIDVNMTSYVARDTYVEMGKLRGYDPKQVSEGLGHSDDRTIQKHYWSGAKQEIIDSMNERIVSL